MVGLLGKYSKFASAGEKAGVRQSLQGPNATAAAPESAPSTDDAPV
jgi:myo-inositol-1(or 4)-monophosphatase